MEKHIALTVSVEKQENDISDEDIQFLIATANEMLAGKTFCGFNIHISTYDHEIRDQYNGNDKPLDCIGSTRSHYDYHKSPIAPYGW
jgi:hypothetical protein